MVTLQPADRRANIGYIRIAAVILFLIAPGFSSLSAYANTVLSAAVLPTSRSVQVNSAATLFVTLINGGAETATGCRVEPDLNVSFAFSYQTTDPATNEVTGSPGLPVELAPGESQSFLVSLTTTQETPPTEVALGFLCDNAPRVAPISGVNTFDFSASTTPVADIIALGLTPTADGTVYVPTTSRTNAFSVASINLGASATVQVQAQVSNPQLAATTSMCQTDPLSGICINPSTPTSAPVVTDIDSMETPTFAVFVTTSDTLAFDPANSRINVRFSDETGALRGSTSVAVSSTELTAQNLVPVPASGAYIGMNTGDAENGISVSSREQLLGHKMAIERIFYGNQHWSLERINIDQVAAAHLQGRIPMVSYKVGAWKDVVNGTSNAIIDKLAGQIKESGIPMLLTFHHEAEDDACFNTQPNCGEGQTAQDYVNMWRYIHNRFATLNVENVSWNWVVMGWQWGPGGNDDVRNHIESMFPGSDYVDWMSADLYNMAGDCGLTEAQISNRWRDLQVRGQGWYDWAGQFNKPLALAEWGTFDDALVDGRKAQWFRNASATLQNWPAIKAAVYFDRLHTGCDWRIDTGGAAELEGYQELIDNSWFIKG